MVSEGMPGGAEPRGGSGADSGGSPRSLLPRPAAAGCWESVPGASPASAALGAAAATLEHGMELRRFLNSFKTTAGVCYQY